MTTKLTTEEVNQIAVEYQRLRKKAEDGSPEDQKKFRNYQNFCAIRLKPLVLKRVSKYRKFPNYPDLEQDGFEALLMAFKTYNPSKGSFGYWADQYIKTRVSRAANSHSTIKIPIKKARELKPYKTNEIPVILDPSRDPEESFELTEDGLALMEAVESLPLEQQEVLNRVYGLNGFRATKAKGVMEQLSLSRKEYSRLLNQAKKSLKENLSEE